MEKTIWKADMERCLSSVSGNLMVKKPLHVKAWVQTNRPIRLPQVPILIVCEDSTYSQKYFNAIRIKYRFNNIDIPPRNSKGMSLSELVKWAKNIHKEKDKKYEEIYFILDKDIHPDYQKVLNTIKNLKLRSRDSKLVKIVACVAIPCFEYWLLLHLAETTKPFSSSLSLKKEWEKVCEKKFPNTNSEVIFSKITEANVLSEAIKRAKRIHDASALTDDNPSTDIYVLIERLINLANTANKDYTPQNALKVETIS